MTRTMQKSLAALLSIVTLSAGLALPAAAEAHTVTLPSFEETWTEYANQTPAGEMPTMYYRWDGEAYAAYMRDNDRYSYLTIQLRLDADASPTESESVLRTLVESYFDDSYYLRRVDCRGQTCTIHIADAQRRPETAAIADAFWERLNEEYDVSRYVYYANVWENRTYDKFWPTVLYSDAGTVDVAAVNAYLAEHAPEWYAEQNDSGVQIHHKTLTASECPPNLSAGVVAELQAEFGLQVELRFLPKGERPFGDRDGICKYYIWNKGDVDNNNRVDIDDAYAVLCEYVTGIVGEQTADDWDALRDVNADGSVNADDAVMILRYYVNETVLGSTVSWETLAADAAAADA